MLATTDECEALTLEADISLSSSCASPKMHKGNSILVQMIKSKLGCPEMPLFLLWMLEVSQINILLINDKIIMVSMQKLKQVVIKVFKVNTEPILHYSN